MRIKPHQLDSELNKVLLPVYLVTGDEPLLVQEALDSIRQQCIKHGYDERKILEVDRKFDWQTLNQEANTLSLFAEKCLTELRLGKSKPGTPGSKALVEYCSNLPDDKILLISADKIDAASLKSKWCSKIDEVGGIVQIWPINLNEMPRWLEGRARKIGLNFSYDALSLLADRLEGNLLAAQQELEKLKLLHTESGKELSAEDVLKSVSDSSKYDVFNLTDACLNGDTNLATKIIQNLKTTGTEPTYILWALSKELRLIALLAHANQKGQSLANVFKQQRVIQRRQPALSKTSQRLSPGKLQTLLMQCKYVDDSIKGVEKSLSPWDILMDICIQMSGKKLNHSNQVTL